MGLFVADTHGSVSSNLVGWFVVCCRHVQNGHKLNIFNRELEKYVYCKWCQTDYSRKKYWRNLSSWLSDWNANKLWYVFVDISALVSLFTKMKKQDAEECSNQGEEVPSTPEGTESTVATEDGSDARCVKEPEQTSQTDTPPQGDKAASEGRTNLQLLAK